MPSYVDRPALDEVADDADRLLERGHRGRRLAQHPPGRVAAADAEVHPAAARSRRASASADAVTLGSRVAGFVTQVPRRIVGRGPAISVSSGYGRATGRASRTASRSSKPAASAWRVRASVRSMVWSGLSVNPNCMSAPSGPGMKGSAVLLQTVEPGRMVARRYGRTRSP